MSELVICMLLLGLAAVSIFLLPVIREKEYYAAVRFGLIILGVAVVMYLLLGTPVTHETP